MFAHGFISIWKRSQTVKFRIYFSDAAWLSFTSFAWRLIAFDDLMAYGTHGTNSMIFSQIFSAFQVTLFSARPKFLWRTSSI